MKRFIVLCLLTFSALFVHAEEKDAIIVCDNGLEMFAWDLEFVRHAEQSVDISPCFFGGTIARQLLSAIETRLQERPNLQVNILATPILLEKEDKAIIERLKREYPNNFRIVHASNVLVLWPDISGIDNHVKMCIVDEKYFSMGGTNLEQAQCAEGTYTPDRNSNKDNEIAAQLPAGMRDQDIVGRGPLAKDLRIIFCKLFALWDNYNTTLNLQKNPEAFANNPFYFEVTANPTVESFDASNQPVTVENNQIKVLLSGPHQKNNVITDEYVRLIKGAKEEIRIANLYFTPEDPVFEALLDAVSRGVKITIITNGITDISPAYTNYFAWGSRRFYFPLFHGKRYKIWEYFTARRKKPKNVRIFEYYVKDILLHKKMMIVDDETFLLGSYNLGMKSHYCDYESVAVIHNKEIVREIEKVHHRDLQFCREVSVDEACDWYFDPVKSYIGELQLRFHGLI